MASLTRNTRTAEPIRWNRDDWQRHLVWSRGEDRSTKCFRCGLSSLHWLCIYHPSMMFLDRRRSALNQADRRHWSTRRARWTAANDHPEVPTSSKKTVLLICIETIRWSVNSLRYWKRVTQEFLRSIIANRQQMQGTTNNKNVSKRKKKQDSCVLPFRLNVRVHGKHWRVRWLSFENIPTTREERTEERQREKS